MAPIDDAPHPADVVPISRARSRRKKSAEPSRLEIDIISRHAAALTLSAKMRYCGPLGGWHVWNGACWALDKCEQVREFAKDVARSIATEAGVLFDDDLWTVAQRYGTARGIDMILSVMRSLPGIVFAPEDADRDPFAMACLNGVTDLRTGLLRPADASDIITRSCPVAYDPNAQAPRFERFLAEVQPDARVREYLQRLFGYTAVGIIREHVIGVFWGPGANGKSVLGDIVTHVLGGYAQPGPSSLIVSNGQSEPHPTDVASCAGARLVIVHETQRGAKFDSSKVKLLTGGDKLTARHMRQDFYSFTPTHTLVMLSNYRPSADSSDYAFWRRVHLVPFDVVIAEERRDPLLGEALRAEAAGILRWVVQGALEWQRIGLTPPDVVREQTERYRVSEDVIGMFIDERCVRLAEARTSASTLYEAYASWAKATGHRAARGNDFSSELDGRGFKRVTSNGRRFYLGIGLHTDATDDGERGQPW